MFNNLPTIPPFTRIIDLIFLFNPKYFMQNHKMWKVAFESKHTMFKGFFELLVGP
jgi:hypothetical protein